MAARRSALLRSVVIFSIALAVRLAVWSELAHHPLFRAPQLDSLEYVRWASEIAAGDFRWPASPPHGPGYPFFLAGVFRLFPDSLPAASISQALLGASTCVAIAALTGIWFGPLAAWAGGLLLAVNGVVAWTDVSLLAEGLLLLLMTGALLFLGNGPVTSSRAALAGLLTGLSALVRPTILVLLPVVVGTLARREGLRRRGFVMAGLATGAAGLVLPARHCRQLASERSPALRPGARRLQLLHRQLAGRHRAPDRPFGRPRRSGQIFGRSEWPERSSAVPAAGSMRPTRSSGRCLPSIATTKPAAALLIQNARARGKEAEALGYLRGLAIPGS